MAKFEKAGVFGEAAKGLLETYERIWVSKKQLPTYTYHRSNGYYEYDAR